MREIFLTGATGCVGRSLLNMLVRKPDIGRIYLLIRSNLRDNAEERMIKLIDELFDPQDRLFAQTKCAAISGNLRKPMLRLSENCIDMIQNCDQIIHLGASTDFSATIEDARADNVIGTKNLILLSQNLVKLKRFDYVSTAFVAGTKSGIVDEYDFDRQQSFANAYEQSKFEAEALVKHYAKEIPTVIYRPSIIVGDSRNGFTPSFNVLYWPLKLMATQALPMIACNPQAKLDIVPVDFVAESMAALLDQQDAIGQTFHLCAGYKKQVNIARVLSDAKSLANLKTKFIVPFPIFNLIKSSPLKRIFSNEYWQATEFARPYYPYLQGKSAQFNASRTHAVLENLGVALPDWKTYKEEIFRFCMDSRWGKKLPQPVYAYYQ